MNAMEHGNRYRPEVPVVIEVLCSDADLSVRINDQGGIRDPAPDKEVPELESKLKGLRLGMRELQPQANPCNARLITRNEQG